jgi:hypothetical protein
MIAEMVTAQKGIGSHCFILHGSAGMNPHDIHVCMYVCMHVCMYRHLFYTFCWCQCIIFYLNEQSRIRAWKLCYLF